MPRRLNFALGGATLALALSPAAALAAAKSPTVTVRVEGLNKTLLAPTQVHAPKTGSITKGGTPKGQCSANSAAGALDVATRHHWGGKYAGSGLGIEITRIFNETHLFSGKLYWSIWVGDGYAQQGLCGIKPRPGEQLLFAAVPLSFKGSLLALSAPSRATAGRAFKVTVYRVSAKGKRIPLAHAHVSGRGVTTTTNGQGIATVDPSKAGTLTLQASHTGDIRSAPESVRVS